MRQPVKTDSVSIKNDKLKKNMKNFTLLVCFFLAGFFAAQNNFEYERTWGTYFGPAGAQMSGNYMQMGIAFDSQKNMHMRGHIWYNSFYPDTYYNQFILGGAQNYLPPHNNQFDVAITANGSLTKYGYQYAGSLAPAAQVSWLHYIDGQDNSFVQYFLGSAPLLSATSGVWMPVDPENSDKKNMLAKYAANGALVWATFLPGKTYQNAVRVDEVGNVYISGLTTISQNFTTPGVLQENFDIMYDAQNNVLANAYLVKLNSNGQLVWATYLPAAVTNMAYYGNALYMITGPNTNSNLSTLATAGAFQSTVSSVALAKINTDTGQRSWGTYYGPAVTTSLFLALDIEVNETGVYLTGEDYNLNNSNFFATPGSFRTQVVGDSDIFLSKFDHSGNRQWSTYFGGNGWEQNSFDKVLSLNGSEIYISGSTYGSTDNISTAGAYQTAPENFNSTTTNLFFAKFNAGGNLIWSSYYGGSLLATSTQKPLNIVYNGGKLFLYGSTNSNVGFTTEGAWMPERNPNNTNETNAFIARFDLKNAMSTAEADAAKDLVLYNNPNSGNFSLSGSILAKEKCGIKIYDMSGRMVYQQELSKNKTQQFNLEGKLSKGNYLIEVTGGADQKLKVFKMTVK